MSPLCQQLHSSFYRNITAGNSTLTCAQRCQDLQPFINFPSFVCKQENNENEMVYEKYKLQVSLEW
jgi:hypothetical protein